MNSEEEAPAQPKSGPKRPLPDFLAGRVSAEQYAKWLKSKAEAHVRRDRKRDFLRADLAAYKDAIHAEVVESQGRDAYTGEELRWELLCAYDNDESKAGARPTRRASRCFRRWTTSDTSLNAASFKICAWRTNDTKNDLAHGSFLELCERALRQAGYEVTAPRPSPKQPG